MNILLISNYVMGVGGINTQVDLLHTYLNKENTIQADIFSTKGNPLQRFWKAFLLIHIAKRYDVLHVHACSYWGMVPAVMGIIAGKLLRKRIIITYHGGEAAEFFAKHTKFVQRWLGRADKIIVLSGFLKNIFEQYDIPCEIIPNIIELQPHQQLIENSRITRFISIRHLEPLYDIPCILQAYEYVLKRYPYITLNILGKGSLQQNLEQFVIEHKLTGVRFLGQIPNQQIYEHLNNADVMLSASKADNMPMSLLEAMNMGILVIATKVGGVPYIIEDGKTGLLFPSGDVQQLADKMIWALENPTNVQGIVKNAQVNVQQYSWKNIKEKLIQIYE